MTFKKFIDSAKKTAKEVGKATVEFIKSDEGQFYIKGIALGISIGAAMQAKRISKKTGIPYKELVSC